ncbi:MAG: acetoacetyl-CoA reductase [Gammaproteobacteria bacterium]|nr:acetoacetyl-CoA reductase [Gammaproteobacteria bacterium]
MAEQTVLVTGGTGAIGSEISEQLAQQGHRVFANCHPADAERSAAVMESLQNKDLDVILSIFDVTDFDACGTAISGMATEYGSLDIVVNAAGITRDAQLAKMTPEDWDAVLRTNLDSVYNVTRHCVPEMIAQGYGRIINISSVNGERGQFGQTNYSAAKAGMHGFTMALAREVARHGITVNSVSPGYIESPMIMAVPEKVREKIVADIPVGRFGVPADIARTVCFLADREAGFITGSNVSVNGGFHIGS